jgi:hypothetical protein
MKPLERIIATAQQTPRRIVLPEGEDPRIIRRKALPREAVSWLGASDTDVVLWGFEDLPGGRILL